MSKDQAPDRTKREKDANAKKLEAEAALAEAEARKALAQAEHHEHEAAIAAIKRVGVEEAEISRKSSDYHHRVYRLAGTISSGTAGHAIESLVEFHRVDPGCDITIMIDSPGGDIIAGNNLIDTILWLREEGHKITTVSQGMAASMAGILLQTGDERIMGPNGVMLIHEASFMAGGSFGQVEDTVEFVKKLQDKLLDILSERSTLTKQQIKNRWKRTNWWLNANEALEYGFVDRIA